MTTSPSEACVSCRFWNRLEPGHIYADCRRLPPQFNLTVNVRHDAYGRHQHDITVSRFPHAQWPNTNQDEWCGEYRSKTDG